MSTAPSVESVFGTRSRVRVLRVLHGVQVPLNASQVAARTGLSQPAVAKALDELAALGIVASSPAGRAWVHWLVRDNLYVQRMVDPVLAAETDISRQLLDDLDSWFGPAAASVVLFGSHARGEQRADSDIDVVLVASDERGKEQLETVVQEASPVLRRRYGASLAPIIYDLREASALWRRAPDLWASIERDGVVVRGLAPSDWRGDDEEE
ncbi:MAG TPA: nucleotidyltransferase domain-containing protein [Coriobacteriia bacterium]